MSCLPLAAKTHRTALLAIKVWRYVEQATLDQLRLGNWRGHAQYRLIGKKRRAGAKGCRASTAGSERPLSAFDARWTFPVGARQGFRVIADI